MKQYSASLVIREMQIKTTVQSQFTHVRMSKSKKTDRIKVARIWRNRNSQCTASGNVK